MFISAREFIKALESDGFVNIRTKGSHHFYQHFDVPRSFATHTNIDCRCSSRCTLLCITSPRTKIWPRKMRTSVRAGESSSKQALPLASGRLLSQVPPRRLKCDGTEQQMSSLSEPEHPVCRQRLWRAIGEHRLSCSTPITTLADTLC